MKPQEAIRIIKIALAEVEWEYPMDYAAAFETAIEALEKQVPKKPIKKKMATLNKTPNAFSWESTRCCPRCKSNLVVKIFGKHLEDYCPL